MTLPPNHPTITAKMFLIIGFMVIGFYVVLLRMIYL